MLKLFAQVQDLVKNCDPSQVGKDPACISLPKTPAGSDQLETILTIAFGIIGVVALMYTVVAGLKFVTSRGNPEKVAQARQQIIYGAIGLALVAAAEAIVIFVLGRL